MSGLAVVELCRKREIIRINGQLTIPFVYSMGEIFDDDVKLFNLEIYRREIASRRIVNFTFHNYMIYIAFLGSLAAASLPRDSDDCEPFFITVA